MKMKPVIDIVLASYNGQEFIEEQIKSIQDNIGYDNLVKRLIVVDDGSLDNTVELVTQLALLDSKIELYQNNESNRGPSKNFEYGIKLTSSKYVMLADQDDVWMSNKIEACLEEAEKNSSEASTRPMLVCSDLQVVDVNLKKISDSYFTLKAIPPNWHQNFNNLIQQNSLSGCTMMFNQELVSKALPIPIDAYMHDWWIALVAKQFGMIRFIEQPLVQYRQHEQNTIGAKKFTFRSWTIDFLSNFKRFNGSFQKISRQAKRFKSTYDLEEENETLNCLSCWDYLSRRQKVKAFLTRKIWRSNLKSKMVLLISILFT